MMKYILVAALISMILLVSACGPKGPGPYDSLAQCMSGNSVIMYGTEWCPHCQNQKKLFDSSFQYINYVDCDKYRNQCISAGVEGYPTWVINGTNYPGEQNIYDLATRSGCQAMLAPTT